MTFLDWIKPMTEAQAADLGYTHHGKYHGIPIFFQEPRRPEDPPCICVKWAPLDLVFDAVSAVDIFLQTCFKGWDEATFCFQVGEKVAKQPDLE